MSCPAAGNNFDHQALHEWEGSSCEDESVEQAEAGLRRGLRNAFAIVAMFSLGVVLIAVPQWVDWVVRLAIGGGW